MPLIIIHGGDLGRRKGTLYRTLLKGPYLRVPQGPFRKLLKLRLRRDVASVQIVDSAQYKDLGGAVGASAVGALLFGDVGLVAGAILGGNKLEVSFVCRLHDGRQLVATAEHRVFNAYFMEYVALAAAEVAQAAA